MFTFFRSKKSKGFHELRIKDILKETPKAVRIKLEIPENLRSAFTHAAGQYVDIERSIKSKKIVRSYSICSSNSVLEYIEILVKIVPGGLFSTFANTSLKKGDVLLASIPQGKFILPTDNGTPKNYIAFATGSGITPILNMAQDIVLQKTASTFTIVYGNTTLENTLFKKDLDELESKYPDKLSVRYIFSQEAVEGSLSGRIDEEKIKNLIGENKNIHGFFLCGQYEMVQSTKSLLLSMGFAEKDIHFELFFVPPKKTNKSAAVKNYTVHLSADNEEYTFICPSDAYILDVLLTKGFQAPYGCKNGVCSKCKVKLIKGEVEGENEYALSKKEIQENFIVTCRCKPLSDIDIAYTE